MSTKKKVSLDIFEDAVLPQLQLKHPEIAELQQAIKDGYAIYETDGEGKDCPVNYKVTGSTKAAGKTADELDAEIDARIAAAVKAATKDLAAPRPAKRVAGATEDDGANNEAKAVRVPAEVKRYGSIQHFAQLKRNGMEQEERCFAFGMWSLAAMGNPKGLAWCNDHGIEVKVHSEGSNTAGGFAVPEVLSTDLIDLKEKYGVARRLFDRYPMTSDTLKINRRASGLTASFTPENQAATESTMSLDQVQLVAKDLTAITRVSGQLNMDSILNWSDRLAYEIAYAFSNKEDNCGFLGDASLTYGGMTGLLVQLKNKWGTGGAPGTGVGLIKQGTSNTWGAMVMGDFDAVVGALPQYADTDRCAWVMHRTFYYTIVEKLIQAAGGVPAYEVRQGQRAPRPIFKGYPVEFSQVYPSTSTSAQVVATLGDHALAAAFGDRQSDSIDFNAYATVGGQSMWERNQMGVRGIERFDINVHDVGDGSAVAGPVVGLIVG